MNPRGLPPLVPPHLLWTPSCTPWPSSSRPLFQTPLTLPTPLVSGLCHYLIYPRPTAERPQPRACRTRGCPAARPAFAHPTVAGRSQSQPTGEFPFGLSRSWCKRPSNRGPRGARNPPWRGPESLGARRICLVARSRVRGRCTPKLLARRLAGKGAPGRRRE